MLLLYQSRHCVCMDRLYDSMSMYAYIPENPAAMMMFLWSGCLSITGLLSGDI